MKYNKKYIKGFLSIGILVVLAIMAPSFVFSVQDMYRMQRTWQGERNGLDMAVLNQSYDTLRNRMVSFADGISNDKEYFVTGTDYQVDSVHFDVLDNVFSQEYFAIMADTGIVMPALPEFYEKIGHGILKSKKYVIYDAEMNDGIGNIAFLLWYMEVEIAHEYHIRLLIDAEDYTLYYMEYVEDDGTNAILERGLDWDYFGINGRDKKISYWAEEVAQHLTQYCYYYYEAGIENAQSFIEYAESVEQQSEEIMNESYAVVTDSTITVDELGDRKSNSELHFGENTLAWEIIMELTKDNQLKCSCGISELKELIMEFDS